jgi:hypothetical protein
MKIPFRWMLIGLAASWIVPPLLCQEQPSSADAFRMASQAGVPTDWTHRHVMFSWGPEDSETRLSVRNEPRYWLQLLRRHTLENTASADVSHIDDWAGRQLAQRRSEHLEPKEEVEFTDDNAVGLGTGRNGRHKQRLERDWNQAMNTGFSSYPSSKYPAKYSFSSADSSCSNDYVVFTLGSSSSSSFNIIAFSNLYLNSSGGSSFCSGSAPTLLFAYFASTGSTPGGLNTSPTLSLDGTQVAFIEAAGSGAVFHVLKWQAASSTPTFPHSTGTLNNCATNGSLPCEYSLGYAGTNTATRSSPFVDYATDTAYVSDNAGNLYAVSPVFGGGTPAVKSGWPAAGLNVGTVTPLTAPVYDSVSQRIFVAGATNGLLYYFKTTGTCGATPAPCLGGSISVSSGTIAEPPVVDSTTQRVFVFSNGAPSGSGVSGAALVQADTSLNPANRIVAGIGGGSANTIHLGDFNNTYLDSGAGASGAAVYACGDRSSLLTDSPVLYAFPFTSSGALNATALSGSGLFLTTSLLGVGAAGSCSSITENFNHTTNNDRIFVGVTSNCTTGETAGCILSYDITSGFPSASAAHGAEPGGTSGIVIDNVADQSGGTQLTTDIYFLSAQSGGIGATCAKYSGGTVSGNCAVSLTQKGLQ